MNTEPHALTVCNTAQERTEGPAFAPCTRSSAGVFWVALFFNTVFRGLLKRRNSGLSVVCPTQFSHPAKVKQSRRNSLTYWQPNLTSNCGVRVHTFNIVQQERDITQIWGGKSIHKWHLQCTFIKIHECLVFAMANEIQHQWLKTVACCFQRS